MQKISPFLWFDNNAEKAVNFYVSLFKNSKILSVSRYGEAVVSNFWSMPNPKTQSVLRSAFARMAKQKELRTEITSR